MMISSAWHALPSREVLAALESNAAGGLSVAAAGQRLDQSGPNALPEGTSRPLWRVFVSQFRSPLIYLLLLAAVIAAAVGESTDPLVILAVVIVNAVIGTFQEGRAERSLTA